MLALWAAAAGLSSARWPQLRTACAPLLAGPVMSGPCAATPARQQAKRVLFDAINKFDGMKERDGAVSIDFGVKGGELDKDSRAPSNLAANGGFYAVSDDVGRAADSVLQAVDALELLNPTADATQFFGTREGALCPLHGSWCNIFTTAADATFSAKSKRGDATVYNRVDGVTGRVWNVINFLGTENATGPPALEQFRVQLSATALSPKRLELVFRVVQARLTKLSVPLPLLCFPLLIAAFRRLGLPALGGVLPLLLSAFLVKVPALPLPLFGRRVSLTFPVPGPALTSVLFFFSRKERPRAYFDVLYLDDELRVHRTGQGNIFVQRKPLWG
uniref:Plastid lipid-associated protein/fibrillin conserved domain-containing protein n=1 Tax=Coccolithus braarudii TaxID=221442 RepID=A0A7S0PZC9_9EUKA